jgi:N-acyl-D-amino-acid deacylase
MWGMAPLRRWFSACLLVLLSAVGATADDQPYDLILRGGRIADGSGNPWFHGDVAVRGGRIAAVGRLPHQESRRTLDCRGLVVAPGFIDIHSHSDHLLLEDGDAQSKIRQGVTTEVLGEETSGGPYKGKLAPWSMRIGGETLTWSTLGEYLETLERRRIATNVASYVGLGNIWRCVMGDSFERPRPEELAAMKELVEEAMRDGAFGLSSMLASPPCLLATADEVVELCRVAGRHGGIYSTHIRNEGSEVIAAVKEAIAIGERAGVRVDIIHLKIADERLWGRMRELVALVDEARGRGVDVQANVYPYTRGNNALITILPPWAHEGGRARLFARLQDPAERRRMKSDILSGLPGWYNHYLAVGGDWSRMLVNADLGERNKKFEGLTMERIISSWREERDPSIEPLDVLFDFLLEEKGGISTIYAHHTEEDMNLALVQPWCSIGSDGSAYAIEGPLRRGKPHPRNFGTFPRVLGEYVRERKLLRLEDAVRKMTSLNAAKLGITDRGLLRPGNHADITVFDAERVACRSTYLDPFQYPEGIEHVIVNGELVLESGRHTGARPGRALRRGR